MTAASSQIFQAAVFGTFAFCNGIKCSPCFDVELMDMLKGRWCDETPKGEASTLRLLTEWEKSWVAASLAA